jgi:hypothetical protein
VFFGTGLVSDRWHGSDERVRLDVLEKGAATLAALWPRLADVLGPPETSTPDEVSNEGDAHVRP